MFLYRVTNNHETRVDRGGHSFENGETKEVAVEDYRRLEITSCGYFTVELLDENYELLAEGGSEGQHPEVSVDPVTSSGDAASSEQNQEQALQNEEQQADNAQSQVDNVDAGSLSADEIEAARQNVTDAERAAAEAQRNLDNARQG